MQILTKCQSSLLLIFSAKHELLFSVFFRKNKNQNAVKKKRAYLLEKENLRSYPGSMCLCACEVEFLYCKALGVISGVLMTDADWLEIK